MRIRFFAAAAEAAGTPEADVDCRGSLSDLVAMLGRTDDTLRRVLAQCSFLIDGRVADPTDPLPPDGCVDVLPPFAGG